MSSWNSYPKVYNLGHPAIESLLEGDCVFEEKIDGSQFSFGVFEGTLRCRSKSKELVLDAPEKMFEAAVTAAKNLQQVLHDGWTYRAEYLQRPRHNGLEYGRVPRSHLIVFDVATGPERYLPRAEKEREAERIGLEVVPQLYAEGLDSQSLEDLLTRTSVLGAAPIEGVVIKNYSRFGLDGKPLMGKHVSEQFKEAQRRQWTKENPKQGDILESLGASYRTEARWLKAMQSMRDAGRLESSPRDIGPMLKVVQADIDEECREEIAEELLRWAMPHVRRAAIRGLPDWYKTQLLRKQLGEDK